ncbi:urate hydroxylase PuuD [Polycladidibacter hongkongensis]|uniref:urate hydroxylase PuuD n=1 Tax=Polycladidibacter hongkongensis TaxID=1647556 RepID=UPI0008314BEA|nr:urate hydroxylase PuuD [Pseudovibrio hongkongensis]
MLYSYFLDWANLLARFSHIIVGIGWIGASFYFVALDFSLQKQEGDEDELLGSAWEVHGGGFYQTKKYLVAPAHLPSNLIWYKWEAYLTFLSGFVLLSLQYYVNASSYLLAPESSLRPLEGVCISVLALGGGWLAYSGLCASRLTRWPWLLGLSVVALLGLITTLLTPVFSGRAVLLHAGALMGTIMACNVFLVIIPNQRKIVGALLVGDVPDARLGAIGKQRSMHNTYFTLPVLALMLSPHYAVLSSYEWHGVVVLLILVLGASLRHLWISHEAGRAFADLRFAITSAVLALGTLMWLLMPDASLAPREKPVGVHQALKIVEQHCVTCHDTIPQHESFSSAPKGMVLKTEADLRRFRAEILRQVVYSEQMPLGNETGMTSAERMKLGAFLLAR